MSESDRQHGVNPIGGDELPPRRAVASDLKPRKARMVSVVNLHKSRSFHLGNQQKIGPGQTGKIPLALWNSVEIPWLQKAERGDVPE